MYKKTGVRVALVWIISFLIIIVYYTFATVAIDVKISEDEIASLVYNSSVVKQEDYKKVISKIERMKFYRSDAKPETREQYLHVYIEGITGDKEMITCSDDLFTHIYNNTIVETYKIPLTTQIYIMCNEEIN